MANPVHLVVPRMHTKNLVLYTNAMLVQARDLLRRYLGSGDVSTLAHCMNYTPHE